MSLPYVNGEKYAAVRQSGSRPSKRDAAGFRNASPASPWDDNGSNDENMALASTSSTMADTHNSNQIHNGNNSIRRDVADFRILVAARIRPFTQREVRQWRLGRRAADAHDEELEEARRARAALRQPFGPDHKPLNATHFGPDGMWTRRHDDDGTPHRDSPDTNEVPLPIVEVDSDGKTVVLLDAQSLSNDAVNNGMVGVSGTENTNSGGWPSSVPVRNAFTYDYVYSSFARNVELDVQCTDASPTGQLGKKGAAGWGHASSYVIIDGDDDDAADKTTSTSTAYASPSHHTPAQEAQVEAEQVAIYEQLAVPLVDAALQGYNTCMFAYGQTGSGKTYTMMGTLRHPGLIPRLCKLLFAEVAARNNNDNDAAASVETTARAPPLVTLQLSYMEIYNEQVRDLLKQRPKNAILRYKSRFDRRDVDSDEYRTLKVRHHPSKGIYVDGLTSVPVATWSECEAYLQQGNALRTQCSTATNAKSSRSHAIFQLQVTQRESTGGRVRGREVALEKLSKINLVDLAGSERNTQAKTTGKHLAEANSINASLSTLRRVLDGLIANTALAQSNSSAGSKRGEGAGGKGKKGVVIPYRESLLTYVLSDNLGGNSFTVMCANVSPCAANAGETESTLRYATLAKSVVNHAKLNEAPAARVIREMRDRLRVMQEALRSAPDPLRVAELEEGVQLSEELLREMKGREQGYEAQLQEQAAQAAALRAAVEAHKQQETYWRAEAQRQYREVVELRKALFEATQNGLKKTTTSFPSSGAGADDTQTNVAKGDRGTSCATRSLHLPSLSSTHSPSTAELQSVAVDNDSNELNNRKRGQQNSKELPQQSKKQRQSLPGTDQEGECEGVALSLASRDWKPTHARGTPLSLLSFRDDPRHDLHVALPSLLPGAPSSAPEKTLESSVRVSGGRRRPTSNTAVTALLSGEARRSSLKNVVPRPPQSKPKRSSNPRPYGAENADGRTYNDATTTISTSKGASTQSTNLSTMVPCCNDSHQHNTGEGVEGDVADPPPFYQTEEFLIRTAESAADPEEPSDTGANQHHDLPHHPPLHDSALELGEALGIRLLQEQAEVFQRASGGLEIAGVAATHSIPQQWPTHSPCVAAVRQAQAARDRRRSSMIAAKATAAVVAKNKKKAGKENKSAKKPATAAAESTEAYAELENA